MVQDSSQPHHDMGALTDESGAFSFLDLLPGSYTFAAYSPDGRTASATTLVAPGRIARVRIEV